LCIHEALVTFFQPEFVKFQILDILVAPIVKVLENYLEHTVCDYYKKEVENKTKFIVISHS